MQHLSKKLYQVLHCIRSCPSTRANRTAGPRPRPRLFANGHSRPERAHACCGVQSEIGNLLRSRSKKLLRYSLPAKILYCYCNSLSRSSCILKIWSTPPRFSASRVITPLGSRSRMAGDQSIRRPFLMIHACRGWPAIENGLFGGCLEALEHRKLNSASCRIPPPRRHLAHPSCIMHMVQ
jgi:hypothetical protein